MNNVLKKITIVGGGTAGWLTAGIIAAEHQANDKYGIQLTLIESPDVNTVGVGEGTWPTMRDTLQKMGISETDLIRECDASFKQGSKFIKWVTGAENDCYHHPFVVPQGYFETNLVGYWQTQRENISFADAVCFQPHLCKQGRAPKQKTTPEYAAVASYAYHLDAGKFAALLQKHCTEKLGVRHISDHVTATNSADNDDIASVTTQNHGDIDGDLFIDCTGFSSLLLGKHYKIPYIDKNGFLFNDSALVVQVPYADQNSPIASQTLSTAQSAGWIWDIGLPSRRGVGHVYSSAHISDDKAEKELRNYIQASLGKTKESISIRKISFNPGHREVFWYKNCVAIGMAAGFLEPLEASALVLVELSAAMISDELPANREIMDITAKNFNSRFSYRWDRIIDFLKLHYVLTQRTDSDYWLDNCRDETIPQRLQELLTLWRYQSPSRNDFSQIEEIFPSASYQYVLYGMDFKTQARVTTKKSENAVIGFQHFQKNTRLTNKYLAGLPSNREMINNIKQFGMQKISHYSA